MFCSHDWEPRTGMDSGSVCAHCGKVSDRECIPGSGLGTGELLPRGSVYIPPHMACEITPGRPQEKRSFLDRLLGIYPTR